MNIADRIIGYLLIKCDDILLTDYYYKRHNKRIGFDSNKYIFRKDQVSFIHVPKTAGTSLTKTLYKTDDYHKYCNLRMHRPVSKYCPPDQYPYLTILREPIARVWSHYNMVLNCHSSSPYTKPASKGLQCFLDHCWQVRNIYCRYYSGFPFKKPNKKLYDKAIINLKNFKFVVDFNNFQNNVNDLLLDNCANAYDFPQCRKQYYEEPTLEEYELIRKYNQFDIDLYWQYVDNNFNINYDLNAVKRK